MAFELIYTSTPRGLVPGSYGFCVVARSRAMSERVAVVLKELSGYRRIAGATPVAYSHFVFDDGGRGVRAIARIADAGLDYSNRTNQIAHFITLDGNDLVPCGPAELCAANPPLFQRRWDAPPQWFEAPTPVHNRVEPRFQSSEWQNLLGDLGWAGALASTVKTGQSVAIVARPEQNVLRLFQESIYLLDPSQRWKATFSTYYTKTPGNVLIQWKTVFAGTPEEAAFRATPNCLLIDLANPSRVGAPERFHGSPECARLVERARRELLRAPEPVASPGAIPNLATAGAANAYDVGSTPIYGQSSSPGQPDFRGLNPQDQGVYAVRQPVPSQGAPSVPRKGGKKVLNYGRPAPGTQGPSITPRREKKDSTKTWIVFLVGMIVTLTLALAIVLAVKSDVSDLVKWTKNWFEHPQEITENAAPDAGNKSAAETVKNATNAAPASPRQPEQPAQPDEGKKADSGAEGQSAADVAASEANATDTTDNHPEGESVESNADEEASDTGGDISGSVSLSGDDQTSDSSEEAALNAFRVAFEKIKKNKSIDKVENILKRRSEDNQQRSSGVVANQQNNDTYSIPVFEGVENVLPMFITNENVKYRFKISLKWEGISFERFGKEWKEVGDKNNERYIDVGEWLKNANANNELSSKIFYGKYKINNDKRNINNGVKFEEIDFFSRLNYVRNKLLAFEIRKNEIDSWNNVQVNLIVEKNGKTEFETGYVRLLTPDRNYFQGDDKLFGFKTNNDNDQGKKQIICLTKNNQLANRDKLAKKKALVFDLEFKFDEKKYVLNKHIDSVNNKNVVVFELVLKDDDNKPSGVLEDKTYAILTTHASEARIDKVFLVSVQENELENLLKNSSKDMKGILDDVDKKMQKKECEVTCYTYGDRELELSGSGDGKFIMWNEEDLELLCEPEPLKGKGSKGIEHYRFPDQQSSVSLQSN